jgi:hypothetical protein
MQALRKAISVMDVDIDDVIEDGRPSGHRILPCSRGCGYPVKMIGHTLNPGSQTGARFLLGK